MESATDNKMPTRQLKAFAGHYPHFCHFSFSPLNSCFLLRHSGILTLIIICHHLAGNCCMSSSIISSSIITSSSTLTMAMYNIASGEEEGEVKVTLPFLPISTVSVSFSEEVENQLASSAHHGHHHRRRRRHARFGSFWSSEFKYQDILIILLTIIALFGLTFFLVLLLSSSSASTKPDAEERIPGKCVSVQFRVYFLTLFVLTD